VNYGTVYRWDTGDAVRAASRDDLSVAMMARLDDPDGVYRDRIDGRLVYVAGEDTEAAASCDYEIGAPRARRTDEDNEFDDLCTLMGLV